MVLDAAVNHHKYIFIDEADFNLAKTRHRGRNLIGQQATCQVPGQLVENISMCTAISISALLIVFLNEIEQACQVEGVIYVIVWDNVTFHHVELVQEWFQAHP
jgi:hypothetical protein